MDIEGSLSCTTHLQPVSSCILYCQRKLDLLLQVGTRCRVPNICSPDSTTSMDCPHHPQTMVELLLLRDKQKQLKIYMKSVAKLTTCIASNSNIRTIDESLRFSASHRMGTVFAHPPLVPRKVDPSQHALSARDVSW